MKIEILTPDYESNIPVQYQEGKANFLGMEISVDSRVLIPRPETELLVKVSADLCKKKEWQVPSVLDIGTGSGAVSLGLAKLIKNCRITAVDISSDALDAARKNITKFGYDDKIELVLSDMFSAFEEECPLFNCIVSNPPYVSDTDYEVLDDWVKAEPKIALSAGGEGMDYLKTIISMSRKFLVPGGFTAVEIGYDQAEKVKREFVKNNFKDVTGFFDFNNYERVIAGWVTI
ncbi:MAG: peptide chain release factor N(5)-glutamine methyltransferase [Candidatus Omnitrophota bacterium]